MEEVGNDYESGGGGNEMTSTTTTTSVLWYVVVAVQLIWLAIQLTYIYANHYVDTLRHVDLAQLNSLPPNTTAARSLDWSQVTDSWFWWQNWPDDTPLTAMPIRGSHHSATYTINNVLSLFAKTQRYTLVEQLNRGVRALDVRLKADGTAYHDFVDLNMSWRRLWSEINSWLLAYPREGLLLTIRDEAYRDHYGVARDAIAAAKPNNTLLMLNDRSFERAATLTVGELRGRIFLWNVNDRTSMPWSDDRQFTVGSIRVDDRYSLATVAEKLDVCKRFYEGLPATVMARERKPPTVRDPTSGERCYLNVLFSSMANANVFRSIQSQANEVNGKFHDWLVESRQPIRGCVFMQDWVD